MSFDTLRSNGDGGVSLSHLTFAFTFAFGVVSVLNIAGSPYSTLRSVAYGAHGLGGYDLRGSICVVRFAYPKPLCGSAVRTDF